MSDREHPDASKSFYLNRDPGPQPDGVALEDSPPPVPEDIKIRWRGLLLVLSFVLLLAIVSRAFGPFAASVVAVVLLLGLAARAIMGRGGYLGGGTDAWWAGGGGDADCGGFAGGGGGGDG